MTTGALERLIRRGGAARRDADERCDLCSLAVPDRHRHLLDTAEDSVLCVCQACALLFVQDAASRGHYRLVPDRRTAIDPVPTKTLGVPVGMAYFVPRTDGAVIAHYPSPIGATQWEVDPDAWQSVVADRPELATLAPEVEALLVNTTHGRRQHWIVPVEDCFRLVAVIQQEWTGMTGGDRVWPAVDAFFEGLGGGRSRGHDTMRTTR